MRKLVNAVIRSTLLKKRLHAIEDKQRFYSYMGSDHKRIYQYQLKRLNEVWNDACTRLPFYRWWKKKNGLPDRIESIAELKKFPKLSKAVLRAKHSLVLKGLGNYTMISTGGTSGITTQFPTSRIEADVSYANCYLGRGWWGMRPFDRILMFWGHSHLFGQGAKRHFRKLKRSTQDWLINTKRVSSYALGAENISDFLELISSYRPEVIISYTSSLYPICKYLESKSIKFNPGPLKCVILTSESVSDKDVELVEKYLHTPLVQEYGMAETGPIAYSHTVPHHMKVFWDSFILTLDQRRLFLTTIGPKEFPLINYDPEDFAESDECCDGSVLILSKIEGKSRGVLNIPCTDGNNKLISAIIFDHILKNLPDIYSIHFRQLEQGIEILLTSNIRLDLNVIKTRVKKEACGEYPQLDFNYIGFKQIAKELKTIAGKNQTIIPSIKSPSKE